MPTAIHDVVASYNGNPTAPHERFRAFNAAWRILENGVLSLLKMDRSSNMKILYPRTEMKIQTLCVHLFLLLSAGCTYSEAEKEEIKASCETLQEFRVSSLSFVGFEYAEIAKIKIVERHSDQIINEFIVDLKNMDYQFHASAHEFRVNMPGDVYNTKNTYDLIMDDQSIYRLHSMKQTMLPQFSMYAEGYGCRMTAYSVNDRVFFDMHQILVIKKSASD
ncbi:MAG: hypothetical protein V4812_18650 [Pseudomonadota bacterium]